MIHRPQRYHRVDPNWHIPFEDEVPKPMHWLEHFAWWFVAGFSVAVLVLVP